MKRAIGIGGVFFRGRDSKKLADWYRKHLGIPAEDGSAVFAWRSFQNPKRMGHTVWAIFPDNTKYFGRRSQKFMLNYRVNNLHHTLQQLRREHVKVEKKIEETSYGKFGWIVDPEGNRIELWEPPRRYRTLEKQFPSE
jgi:predicted enzyme related to lactoylglutathione lyase